MGVGEIRGIRGIREIGIMLKIIFLSPVHPLLTLGFPLPKWQMQSSWVRALQKAGADVKVVRYTPGGKARVSLIERALWNFAVILKAIAPVVRSPLPWSTSTRRGVATTGFGRTGDFFLRKKTGPSEGDRSSTVIIYSLGADVLFPQTLRLIKWLTKAPLVILSGVSPVSDGNPRERAIAKFADLAAVNDEGHAQEWRKLGAKKTVVLPISGVDPELHFRRIRVIRGIRGIRDIDVLFAGTVTPERREFLAELRKLLPETVKFVVKEFVWEEEYAGLMSRAKIVLNPIRPEMKNGANLRMFEIPAFGALELGSYGKKEWLTPGKEMLVYKDAEEAAGLIAKYLKDGKKREEMVERGKGRVFKEHKFEDRARNLMGIIGEIRGIRGLRK